MKKVLPILALVFLICLSQNVVNAQSHFLRLGIEEYNKGHFQYAIDYFQTGLVYTNKPSKLQSNLYFWYAKAQYQQNIPPSNYSEPLNRAIASYPKNANAIYFKAQINRSMEGVSNSVIDDYSKVLELEILSKEPNVYYRNISSYYVLGYDQTYTNYISNETNRDADYYYSVAVISADMNRKEDVIVNLVKSLESGYSNFDYLWVDLYNFKYDLDLYDILNKNHVPTKFFVERYKKDLDITSETIKTYVENKINTWQKKGKFEKTSGYLKRVTPETRIAKIDYYTQAAIDSIGMSKLIWNKLTNEYDADNESFKIIFPSFDPVYIHVPISDAPSFDMYFNELEFNNMKFTLSNGVKPYIIHMNISDPNNGQTYVFDSQDEVAFKSTELNFNFEEMDLVINDLSQNKKAQNTLQSTTIINVGKSDVDTNIPVTSISNKNTYALIIGNEDYTKYQNDLNSEANVDYAKRDAEVFAEYAEKTLGIPKGNITILTDAIGSQMNREIEKLSKLAKYSNGNATLLFYFAGHGFPDEKTKEAYIMPVDISGTNVKSGVKLSALYSKLTEFPTKKSIVILDACFSGGGRNEGLLAARSVAIKPKENPISGNLLIFSSSSGQQSSLPYDNKQHGMFTYFILKKLKESKGDVSMEELKDYVTREVQINAVKINNKEQNPKLQVSPNLENVWMDWKLR
jgi:hypothetical protein